MTTPINPYVAGNPVGDSPAFLGSAGVGEVALTANEYKTAERLRKDYWLCTVFNCASSPKIHVIHDLVRLGWNPVVRVKRHTIDAQAVLEATG
jgi:Protein NO VEIN, C-terminal